MMAEKELSSVIEQSSLSNTQKQSLLDPNNNGIGKQSSTSIKNPSTFLFYCFRIGVWDREETRLFQFTNARLSGSWEIVCWFVERHQQCHCYEKRSTKYQRWKADQLVSSRIYRSLPKFPFGIHQFSTTHSHACLVFNWHSKQGTRLELQKKNGRYDLVPLLSLVLFSVKTAGELSNNLNLPSLEGEF